MTNQPEMTKELSLENVISTAVKIPGVKVNRNAFLAEQFATEGIDIQEILDLGPVEANISREKLSHIANKLILIRTSESSAASFVAGIPGGLAMAATIPADVLQFFGMTLRLAQELSYLYGAQDLWQDGMVDDDRIKNQLILYCGVMFGVSGAVSGVRLLSTQLAKTTLKKLPQKALTKTFWYPLIKQIGKAVGVKVTKTTVAQGISKTIPIVGGVISGGLNFASMMPMAKRLMEALDKANFSYTDEELAADLMQVEGIEEPTEPGIKESENPASLLKGKVSQGIKTAGLGISGLFSKRTASPRSEEAFSKPSDEILTTIEKLAKLKETGIITPEEFENKKKDLLAKL